MSREPADIKPCNSPERKPPERTAHRSIKQEKVPEPGVSATGHC